MASTFKNASLDVGVLEVQQEISIQLLAQELTVIHAVIHALYISNHETSAIL